jgi:hypothetical protein
MILPTLTEVLIVATGFSVVGLYMLIAHTIVKSSEKNSGTTTASPHGHH